MYESSEVLEERILAILALVKEIKTDEKKIEEVPVVKEIPEVFPEHLPGLSPSQQVEIRYRIH
jgi:hypothetical protein